MKIKNVALGTLLGMTVGSGSALAAPADNFEGFNLSLGATAQSSTFETREQGAGSWDYSSASYSGNFSYDRQIQWPNSAAKIGADVNLGYNFKLG